MNEMNFKLPIQLGGNSAGERHLSEVLQAVTKQLNTFYSEEMRIGYFNGKRRRADFCIPYNGKIYLIEFDGIQHSKPIEEFGGLAAFTELRKRDKWENLSFCPSNKICLIRYKVFSNTNDQEACKKAQDKLLKFITPEQVLSDIKKAEHCKYVQNSISYGRRRLKISCDIDDVLLMWRQAHEQKFNCKLSEMREADITAQVATCEKDKEFWSNLSLLEKPDFIPELYSTKRINSKSYTRANFKKVGLPIRPISQVRSQAGNKARYIKGKCDVHIDDSWFNVQQCLNSGLPALLITRPHNAHIKTPYRVNHLKYQEIAKKYYDLFG